jgi:hypothetical protein
LTATADAPARLDERPEDGTQSGGSVCAEVDLVVDAIERETGPCRRRQ